MILGISVHFEMFYQNIFVGQWQSFIETGGAITSKKI
jgi:hypothetical protein